jgi:hypothetical protein
LEAGSQTVFQDTTPATVFLTAENYKKLQDRRAGSAAVILRLEAVTVKYKYMFNN